MQDLQPQPATKGERHSQHNDEVRPRLQGRHSARRYAWMFVMHKRLGPLVPKVACQGGPALMLPLVSGPLQHAAMWLFRPRPPQNRLAYAWARAHSKLGSASDGESNDGPPSSRHGANRDDGTGKPSPLKNAGRYCVTMISGLPRSITTGCPLARSV